MGIAEVELPSPAGSVPPCRSVLDLGSMVRYSVRGREVVSQSYEGGLIPTQDLIDGNNNGKANNKQDQKQARKNEADS
jgi:hypothetical protein